MIMPILLALFLFFVALPLLEGIAGAVGDWFRRIR
jgi:hypothetical protein